MNTNPSKADNPEPRFVSEAIDPVAGGGETRAMVRGEPGLPAGFVWRGTEYRVAERLEIGKTTGLDMGEAYVRRHTFRLRMDDDSVWNVYFLRQPPKASRAAKPKRWYLKTIE